MHTGGTFFTFIFIFRFPFCVSTHHSWENGAKLEIQFPAQRYVFFVLRERSRRLPRVHWSVRAHVQAWYPRLLPTSSLRPCFRLSVPQLLRIIML